MQPGVGLHHGRQDPGAVLAIARCVGAGPDHAFEVVIHANFKPAIPHKHLMLIAGAGDQWQLPDGRDIDQQEP